MSLHPHTQVSPSSKCFSCPYQESVSHAYWMPSDTWLEKVPVPGVKTVSPWSAGFAWAMLFCFTCCFVIAGSTQKGSAQARQHVSLEPRARVLFLFLSYSYFSSFFDQAQQSVGNLIGTSSFSGGSSARHWEEAKSYHRKFYNNNSILSFKYVQCVCSISNSILSFLIFFFLWIASEIFSEWIPLMDLLKKAKPIFF